MTTRRQHAPLEPGVEETWLETFAATFVLSTTCVDDTKCMLWRTRAAVPRLFGAPLRPQLASYQTFVGPIAPHKTVFASCGSSTCVNPTHLHLADRHVAARSGRRAAPSVTGDGDIGSLVSLRLQTLAVCAMDFWSWGRPIGFRCCRHVASILEAFATKSQTDGCRHTNMLQWARARRA